MQDEADKKSESGKDKDENGGADPAISSPSSMENTREEESKDQNESIEIAQAKNDDENMDGNNTDIVVEPTSPIPSFGGSVKSNLVLMVILRMVEDFV